MNKKTSKTLFFALIVAGIIIKSFFLFQQKPFWWDASVYFGMTKYIISFGKQGLWEPLRPLIWPLILSFFSLLGLPLILFAKMAELFFSLGSVFLVFKIAKKLWGIREARIASTLLIFIPVITFYEGVLLTEIPAVFLGISAIYFFINEKYFLAGFISGISFLTKFPMGLIFAAIIILSLNKPNKFWKVSLGFFIPTIIFLVFNFLMYANPALPFIEGSEVFEKSSWYYEKGFDYYLIELLKENIFFIFGLAGLLFLRKKNEFVLLLSFLFLFSYFGLITHKEVRFYILFLPLLSLISAKGIILFWNKKYLKILTFLPLFLFLPLVFGKFIDYYNFNVEFKEDYYKLINNFSTEGNILVSDPRFTLFTDKKLDLLYYKDYDKEYIMRNIKNANLVIMNTCDILCKQGINCETKEEALEYLKNNFFVEHHSSENDCEIFVFKKTQS